MLDLYALPSDFPGLADSRSVNDCCERVAMIEQALADDIDDHRFVPYIQLHEFESLLLAAPGEIARYYPSRQSQVDDLAEAVAEFEGPELVDDGAETAPSKRIAQAVPRYDKVLGGSLIAVEIGLRRIIANCPHFAAWVRALETLSESRA